MPKCAQCGYILPPQFMTPVSDNDHRCKFCMDDKLTLVDGDGVKSTRKDIADEYIKFLKIIKEKNEILKNAARGDVSEIPTKLLD